MNAKKIFKVIGRILLVLLLLTVLCLLTTSIVYHVRLHKALKTMQESGYENLVSAGDYQVNLFRCGNQNGKHTIVALAGYGDGEMCIGWRKMTAPLEAENELLFLDRAGYGLSDDCADEMRVDSIVEHYRTALKNAGVTEPVILMPHSIGGLYATYWVSKYPDEIEAVMILDGTEASEYDGDEADAGGITALMKCGEALGLMPLYIRASFSNVLGTVSKEDLALLLPLMSKTAASDAALSEMNNIAFNINATWDSIVPNDIPKLYLNVTSAVYTKDDLLALGYTAEMLRKAGFAEGGEATDDEVYAAALEYIAHMREDVLMPYTEKMGNCQVVDLLGQHEIFLDKPEESSRILMEFISELDG